MPITTENSNIEETQQQLLNTRNADFNAQQQELKKQEATLKFDAAKENAKDAASAAMEFGQLKGAEAQAQAHTFAAAAVEKATELKDAALEKSAILKDAALEKGSELKDAALKKGAELQDALSGLSESALVKGAEWKEVAAEKGTELKDAVLEKGAELKQAVGAGPVESATCAGAQQYTTKFPFTTTTCSKATKGGTCRETSLEFDNAARIMEQTIAHAASPNDGTIAPAFPASNGKGFAMQAIDQIKGAASGIAGTASSVAHQVANTATSASHFVEAKYEQLTTEGQREKLHNVVEKVSGTLHDMKESVLGHKEERCEQREQIRACVPPILCEQCGAFERIAETPLSPL